MVSYQIQTTLVQDLVIGVGINHEKPWTPTEGGIDANEHGRGIRR